MKLLLWRKSVAALSCHGRRKCLHRVHLQSVSSCDLQTQDDLPISSVASSGPRSLRGNLDGQVGRPPLLTPIFRGLRVRVCQRDFLGVCQINALIYSAWASTKDHGVSVEDVSWQITRSQAGVLVHGVQKNHERIWMPRIGPVV